MKNSFFLILTLLFYGSVSAQDLLAYLDSAEQDYVNITTGTFKSVRLINGYTAETAGNGDLVFSISHRFGPMNGGGYEFFGLDHSSIRFGFEYGLFNKVSLGIGRSSEQKLFDGFIKIKLMEQKSGSRNFPFTITWLEGMALQSEKWINPDYDYPFSARLNYTHELLIARKFSKKFSAQLSPVLVHRNMVDSAANQNLVPAIGAGANYTINSWLSVSGEYYYLFPGNTADLYTNSMSFGVEIESGGGHVFQILISNSIGMTEKQFVPETTGKWSHGDIHLGFNIIRVFSLK